MKFPSDDSSQSSASFGDSDYIRSLLSNDYCLTYSDSLSIETKPDTSLAAAASPATNEPTLKEDLEKKQIQSIVSAFENYANKSAHLANENHTEKAFLKNMKTRPLLDRNTSGSGGKHFHDLNDLMQRAAEAKKLSSETPDQMPRKQKFSFVEQFKSHEEIKKKSEKCLKANYEDRCYAESSMMDCAANFGGLNTTTDIDSNIYLPCSSVDSTKPELSKLDIQSWLNNNESHATPQYDVKPEPFLSRCSDFEMERNSPDRYYSELFDHLKLDSVNLFSDAPLESPSSTTSSLTVDSPLTSPHKMLPPMVPGTRKFHDVENFNFVKHNFHRQARQINRSDGHFGHLAPQKIVENLRNDILSEFSAAKHLFQYEVAQNQIVLPKDECELLNSIVIQKSNNHHQQNNKYQHADSTTSSPPAVNADVETAYDADKTGLVECRWENCWEVHSGQAALVNHIERSHVDSTQSNDYVCFWLNCPRGRRAFNARYKLLIHMRVHSGEKPNKCPFQNCSKAFSRLENLKIHQRSHTGERPYTCTYAGCLKAFSNSSDRAKHQRTHFDTRPYKCMYKGCTKRYTDPSSLRKHAKNHNHDHLTPAKMRKLNYVKPGDIVPCVRNVNSSVPVNPDFTVFNCEEPNILMESYELQSVTHDQMLEYIPYDTIHSNINLSRHLPDEDECLGFNMGQYEQEPSNQFTF